MIFVLFILAAVGFWAIYEVQKGAHIEAMWLENVHRLLGIVAALLAALGIVLAIRWFLAG